MTNVILHKEAVKYSFRCTEQYHSYSLVSFTLTGTQRYCFFESSHFQSIQYCNYKVLPENKFFFWNHECIYMHCSFNSNVDMHMLVLN